MIDGENLSSLAVRLRDSLSFAWNFDPAQDDFAVWKARTRQRVLDALELQSISSAKASVLSEWDGDGYTGQELELGFSNAEVTRAYLLKPKTDRKTPAALLFHDHGSFFSIGKEKLISRPDESEKIEKASAHWVQKLYGGSHFGNELARRGFTVVCADALGWGSREGNGYEAQQALAANLMQFGVSYASVILREDLECLTWLANLPSVDPERVAAIGYSMGGSRAWQMSALSDHAKICVAGGWMGTLKGLMQPGNNQLRGQSAFSMLHPQIAGKLDYPHFAALGAPKPTMIFSGEDDRHFPAAVARDAHRQLQAIWASAGDCEIEANIWPGSGHAFPVEQQKHAIAWLIKALK